MADKKVVIYSISTCPHCKRAKEYLSQKGIKYTDFDVAQDKGKAKEMIIASGQKSVPVIMVDNEIIVGFDQALVDKALAK